ncbi:MAG: PIN domain-containing protein [Candidatus Marinimicrobia bacterium]|nr:PIN domain-containing protein [Candidatus Neomarinimicrobiota bacterium]MBL7010963.1 PIN domain-containing protein [Candidatus Neomarinimicrobiota bacterium]MBL7031392.1 PIN domain-containing protein [Candidatus Neomarinimicrobiota bacterium]
MIVVDTSVWIEFFKNHSSIFPKLKVHLERGEVIAAEPVFGELMQGVKNKRERTIISNYWHHLPKFSMDGIFFKAGEISGNNKWIAKGVGLIDSAILIYAKDRGCQVWTLDKKLLSIIPYKDRFSS